MDLKDYLSNNISNQKESNDTMSFYNKFEEFSRLYAGLYDSIKPSELLLRAQGKYSSKICFIFKDKEHLNTCMEHLKKILPVYGINIWDVLILYVNKFDNENLNYDVLLKELLISDPIIVYIFDNSELNKTLLDKSMSNNVLGFRMINVNNIQNLVVNNVSKDIFDLFEYLITYNY